jgi:hypothetical protein
MRSEKRDNKGGPVTCPIPIKKLIAWAVIVDFLYVVGAAQSQEDARVIRDNFIRGAAQDHTLYCKVEIVLIEAQRLENKGKHYKPRAAYHGMLMP